MNFDLQGKVPLNDRDYLDKVCGVSKLNEGIKDLPLHLLKVIFQTKLPLVMMPRKLS